MQHPMQQHSLDSSMRHSKPQTSPWRDTPAQSVEASAKNMSSQYNQGLKIPNLPKSGSQSKSRPQTQSQQQQTPSFAQAVQRAQQQSYSNTTPTKSGSSRNSVNSVRPTNQAEPGAHILGSVNAQMMPKVNTSYGMSSLNTVLPGMSENSGNMNNNEPRTQPQGASSYTPNVQNLSLTEKASSPSQARTVDSEKYGSKSLLRVMDFSNKEKQSVVLGSDSSQSGLNLGSADERSSHTFASPWQEMSKPFVEPDFKLPDCYKIDTVVPQQQKLQNFDEGASFYIFYTMPRDAMQEAAAVESTNRSWRYHKELKMWLTKDPLSEPIQTNNQEESGIYVFFDPTTWKKIKREYILYYPDIA